MTVREQAALVRHIWPLLAVQDINRSVEFYRDRLGFAVVGKAESEGKIFWCRLERGGASIMLQQADNEDGPPEGRGRGITLYFICDDADALYADLSLRGSQLTPPRLASYGMRQLFVPEPDGYSICFESPTADWEG
jgi:uncharacterized glyoxalase superfamily protein PhnB